MDVSIIPLTEKQLANIECAIDQVHAAFANQRYMTAYGFEEAVKKQGRLLSTGAIYDSLKGAKFFSGFSSILSFGEKSPTVEHRWPRQQAGETIVSAILNHEPFDNIVELFKLSAIYNKTTSEENTALIKHQKNQKGPNDWRRVYKNARVPMEYMPERSTLLPRW